MLKSLMPPLLHMLRFMLAFVLKIAMALLNNTSAPAHGERLKKFTGIVIREGGVAPAAASTNATNIPAAALNTIGGQVNQQGFKRDVDQYMPIANITRIMRRVLPSHAKIADDAKEAIQEYVSEFISFVTAEANWRCNRDYRSTVTPEDVLAAMASLGLDDYLEPLTLFLNKHRAEQNSEQGSMNLLPQFVRQGGDAGARVGFIDNQQRQRTHTVHQPSPSPPPSASTVGYYAPLPPSAATMEEERDFGGLTPAIHEYMLRNHGGGEGSSGGCEFDPFQKF
ncbi:PREDICTED: nuclear transcription factor Y subunit B-9-like [Erythranthe guttata]|uniref:nuclear transcription factor Y subunit B-9-like n=1 Tax=Erythranthe guttata TaxID=4155 RepID=UPI00064DD03C|nr:PREDICTED: nuclear transcription factor Y subunit B-9-like [Erythranthe guttata]|eukprot:XP_012839452.1 PREDICTED: nuclear transcription factor Y subunit B-9-like [Erythranthe guttata]